MVKFSAEQIRMAQTSDTNIIAHPGMPVSDKAETTVQLVNAPNISTSPCAKLIRLMMP